MMENARESRRFRESLTAGMVVAESPGVELAGEKTNGTYDPEGKADKGATLASPSKRVDRIRIRDFPPLPHRKSGYWIEPVCGFSLVLGLDSLFVVVVRGIASTADDNPLMHIVVGLVWVQCLMSALSVLYLLAGGAGVIRRSEDACYPMPEEVEEKLRQSTGSLVELDNIYGPVGSETLGSYCVRCLVWRPPKKGMMDAHHCNTCQRCVKGFDHHCGVFGRCIVRGNLPCFSILLGMLPAGVLTIILAILAATFSAIDDPNATGVAKAAGLRYPIGLLLHV